MSEPDGAPSPSGLRVLRDRNYWPYFVGNLVSNCGTWFQNLAQALLIYRLTKSTLLVGVVNFAQFVATFALAPWAGGAADRFDRRKLMMTMQVASTVVSAVLALAAAQHRATAPVVIAWRWCWAQPPPSRCPPCKRSSRCSCPSTSWPVRSP